MGRDGTKDPQPGETPEQYTRRFARESWHSNPLPTLDAVAAARSEGATLAQLVEIMGVSPQAVHLRHWIERRSDPS